MDATFGTALKNARQTRGITQLELGGLAGTGINFVSQMERGKETLRLDKVLAVLRVLGLELLLVREQRGLSVSNQLERSRRALSGLRSPFDVALR